MRVVQMINKKRQCSEIQQIGTAVNGEIFDKRRSQESLMRKCVTFVEHEGLQHADGEKKGHCDLWANPDCCHR